MIIANKESLLLTPMRLPRITTAIKSKSKSKVSSKIIKLENR
ncbi:MAG: hypothetical protein ACTHJ2_08490 [Candidatus Nitrosocosmicus sp.]